MGEQKRRNGFWPAHKAGNLAATFVEFIRPGDEAKLMQLTGPRPQHCRTALGHALFDLVIGRSSGCAISDCRREFRSLDDLGGVLVCHIEMNGKLDRSSPSWSLCRRCVEEADASKGRIGANKPADIGAQLVHDWFASRGLNRLQPAAEIYSRGF